MYEKVLSNTISDLIIKVKLKKNIKILDFGSGFEPTVLKLIKRKLAKKSIKILSHSYDLYTDEQIISLNNKKENEFYFHSKELENNKEFYDFVLINDVLHHLNIKKKKKDRKIINVFKKKN
jgi:2-polyprenyl-3-methyl-5-hydroxy-6-metoxy-1,4-benzoquinol methylase